MERGRERDQYSEAVKRLRGKVGEEKRIEKYASENVWKLNYHNGKTDSTSYLGSSLNGGRVSNTR